MSQSRKSVRVPAASRRSPRPRASEVAGNVTPVGLPLPRGGGGLAGTVWEQGRMQGWLETFFAVNFNSGAGGTGSHRMVFNRGRAEISSIFSSSKTMHMNTSKSPTIPEGIQCHFEKLVPLFYVLLL